MSKEELIAILKKYGSIAVASKELHIKYNTLYFMCKKYNLPSSQKALSRQKAKSIPNEKVISLYKELGSASKVAKKLGISKSQVFTKVPKTLTQKNRCTKYLCNEDFFNQDNERSFYWAGFIAADGCVKLKDQKYKQLCICLSIKDLKLLEAFKKDIQFEGPIHKHLKGRYKKCEITISSNKVFDSLKRFGIKERKSLNYSMPEWLINNELFRHYLRGYFDGDGTVGLYKKKNRDVRQCTFEILGSEIFLKQVKSKLIKENIIETNNGYLAYKKSIYRLGFGRNRIALSFRNYLYKKSTICLKRKRDVFYDPKVREHKRKGFSEKAREASAKARRVPVCATNIKTGNKKYFKSISAVSPDFHPGLVSDVLRGKQKTHRGHYFTILK